MGDVRGIKEQEIESTDDDDFIIIIGQRSNVSLPTRSLQVQQLVLVHAWSLDLAWSWSPSNAQDGGRDASLIYNICSYIMISNAYSVTRALVCIGIRVGFLVVRLDMDIYNPYLWIGFRDRLHLVIGVCEPVASCDVASVMPVLPLMRLWWWETDPTLQLVSSLYAHINT